MDIYEGVFSALIRMMMFPINIYGYTVTFWGVMVFSLAGGVIFTLVGRLICGDD